MHADTMAANADCIQEELKWLRRVLDLRFAHPSQGNLLTDAPPPSWMGRDCPYAKALGDFDLDAAERLVLILALAACVAPETLDPFLVPNESIGRRFTEFGGIVGAAGGGFIPTIETALYLLAGGDLRTRLEHLALFQQDQRIMSHEILRRDSEPASRSPFGMALLLTPEMLERLTTGEEYVPLFSTEFPAHLITTPLQWDDLVITKAAMSELEDILSWIRHKATLLDTWSLRRRIKPGFRSLFYGPPGTGKSLAAALLGKVTSMPVYRVDLSKVVSKYIGETEKNLAGLFDRAENNNWILFFDEADSLFGKRTESRDAHDRSANQQVSYLLQRIEDFPGIVILASNLRSHVDEAFARRFQSMVYFAVPSEAQRRLLWENQFRDQVYKLAKDVKLEELARQHELSGGSITNVLRYACLKAVSRGSQEIRGEDLLTAIRRELHKEGKFVER